MVSECFLYFYVDHIENAIRHEYNWVLSRMSFFLHIIGSATTLICLLDPETISGEFYANCNIKRNELHPKMNDIELAKKLWEMSQSIVELTIDQQ